MAAKTGTTQGYGDAWIVGYNPNVSLGVWLGYKEQSRSLYYGLQRQTLHPSTRTAMLFGRLMNAANEVKPEIIGANAKFQRPEGVVTRSFCGISGLAPSAACSNAGLVKSDLFNAKAMLPTTADDSITSSSYVSVKGKRYLAHPNTPAEFVHTGGTGVNEAFITRMLGPWKGDASKLFPANSAFASRVVSGAVFNADNVAPAAVQATINGSTLTWSHSPSNDVIGYYIYEGGKKIGTIKDGMSNSFAVSSGSYSVRAVDVTGNLSEMSNVVSVKADLPNPNENVPDENVPDTTDPGNGESMNENISSDEEPESPDDAE